MQAGLSVPYIANLENGRGNPTLTALTNLAQALGGCLRVELDEGEDGPVALPDTLLRFARLPRFADESRRIAAATGQPETTVRERLLAAMAGTGAVSPRRLDELDWHRILDVIILITRPPGP